MRALRAKPGKDIWLFRGLSAAGLVDTVEVAIMPALLGEGTPLLPFPAEQVALRLTDHKAYKTGIVSLKYAVLQISDRIADKHS